MANILSVGLFQSNGCKFRKVSFLKSDQIYSTLKKIVWCGTCQCHSCHAPPHHPSPFVQLLQWSCNFVRDSQQVLDRKKKSVFMYVSRYKPFTGFKISASQRTMMTIFPKNEKKKTFSHDCVSRGQTTFFTLNLWFCLLGQYVQVIALFLIF